MFDHFILFTIKAWNSFCETFTWSAEVLYGIWAIKVYTDIKTTYGFLFTSLYGTGWPKHILDQTVWHHHRDTVYAGKGSALGCLFIFNPLLKHDPTVDLYCRKDAQAADSKFQPYRETY